MSWLEEDKKCFENADELIKKFQASGGEFIVLNKDGGLTKDDGTPLTVKIDCSKRNTFFPVCVNGSHRSHLMKLALAEWCLLNKCLVNKHDAKIALPHGAVSGNDPHTAYKDLTPDNWTEYLCDPPLSNVSDKFTAAYAKAFGHERGPRVGEDQVLNQKLVMNANDYETNLKEVEISRQHMRDWFTQHYYVEASEKQHFYFFCFRHAAIRVIKRYLETRTNFRGITVIAFPFDDTIMAAATARCTNLHEVFYNNFTQYRDVVRNLLVK